MEVLGGVLFMLFGLATGPILVRSSALVDDANWLVSSLTCRIIKTDNEISEQESAPSPAHVLSFHFRFKLRPRRGVERDWHQDGARTWKVATTMIQTETVSRGQRTGRSPRGVMHRSCGQVSPVAGHELRRVCDPYVDSLGPRCESCNAEHPFSEFTWEDTSESLDDFRLRMLQLIPETHNRIHERAASFVLLLSLVLAGVCLWYIPGMIWKLLALPVSILGTWTVGSKMIDVLLHRIMGSVDPQIEV